MPITKIPIIDVGPALAGAPGALEATAAELRRVCEEIGFLSIVNHGVPRALLERAFAAAAAFHAQPLDAKLAVKLDDRMQGYLPYKSSTTRANGLVAVRKPNENEAFFVVPDYEGGNRWPEGLPEFAAAAGETYAACAALAQRLLPLYARALDLPADYFASRCDTPHATLRLTHYPPVEYGQDEYGIAPHTDSSFFTLLAQNAQPGLQVRTPSGDWIDVPVIPDSFVVNTGDILNHWSNGRFISTPHRAFNVGTGPRYAIPFFFHPNKTTLIEALPTCTSADNPPRFEAQTVGDYMAWFRGSNYDHFRQGKAGKQGAAA